MERSLLDINQVINRKFLLKKYKRFLLKHYLQYLTKFLYNDDRPIETKITRKIRQQIEKEITNGRTSFFT